MIVGTLTARLMIREARTLKDKRQVLQSIKDKLRNNFNVSIAEIGDGDSRKLAELGMAMVGMDTHPLKITLGAIVQALRCHPVAELLDFRIEV